MTNIICSVSVEIKSPHTKVWDALINPEKVKQYLFGTNLVCNWKVGSPILFKGEWEGKPYEDKGTVLEFEPEKLLRYNYWSNFSGQPDVPENYEIVSYILKKGDGKTLLTITQTCKTEEVREHSEKNWKMVLDTMKKMLE